jgi:hypothetical protein
VEDMHEQQNVYRADTIGHGDLALQVAETSK